MTSRLIPNETVVSQARTHGPLLVPAAIQYLLTDRDLSAHAILYNLLVAKGLQERRCLHTYTRTHYGVGTALATICRNAGAIVVVHDHAPQARGRAVLAFTWEEHDTHVSLHIGEKKTHLTLASLDPDFATRLLAQFDAVILPTNPHLRGTIKLVCYDHGDVFLTDLGYVDHTFQPINYTADIRAGFDFITTNLATPIPNGRLYVLYGLPGTGKSYYIRSVIAHTQAIYVYVPPSLIPRLTSPDLMGVLLRARDAQDDHIPICLILEDADSSMVQRAMDNANLVGDLLNLSDGFLGELANLHIFATVNAKKTDIDPALLRPGRLGVYLAFHAMDRSHAWEVFSALCTEAQVDPSAPAYMHACAALSARYERPSTQATLADVYALARQAGWTPARRPKTPTPAAPSEARRRTSSEESREMLGVMPLPRSPQPQGPCPDTSV